MSPRSLPILRSLRSFGVDSEGSLLRISPWGLTRTARRNIPEFRDEILSQVSREQSLELLKEIKYLTGAKFRSRLREVVAWFCSEFSLPRGYWELSARVSSVEDHRIEFVLEREGCRNPPNLLATLEPSCFYRSDPWVLFCYLSPVALMGISRLMKIVQEVDSISQELPSISFRTSGGSLEIWVGDIGSLFGLKVLDESTGDAVFVQIDNRPGGLPRFSRQPSSLFTRSFGGLFEAFDEFRSLCLILPAAIADNEFLMSRKVIRLNEPLLASEQVIEETLNRWRSRPGFSETP